MHGIFSSKNGFFPEIYALLSYNVCFLMGRNLFPNFFVPRKCMCSPRVHPIHEFLLTKYYLKFMDHTQARTKC